MWIAKYWQNGHACSSSSNSFLMGIEDCKTRCGTASCAACRKMTRHPGYGGSGIRFPYDCKILLNTKSVMRWRSLSTNITVTKVYSMPFCCSGMKENSLLNRIIYSQRAPLYGAINSKVSFLTPGHLPSYTVSPTPCARPSEHGHSLAFSRERLGWRPASIDKFQISINILDLSRIPNFWLRFRRWLQAMMSRLRSQLQ